MTNIRMSCAQAGAIVFLISCSCRSFAWNYEEHVAISLASYTETCLELKESAVSIEDWDRWCGDPVVALCQAHMVALAADYISEEYIAQEQDKDAAGAGAEGRSGPEKRWAGYLATSRRVVRSSSGSEALQLDCLPGGAAQFVDRSWLTREIDTFLASLPLAIAYLPEVCKSRNCNEGGGEPEYPEWLKTRLYRHRVPAWWNQMTLARRNQTHFQPTSSKRFHYLSGSEPGKSEPAEPGAMQDALFHHAFVMHYLEDSFAAGHNGIDRNSGAGVRQDFAQAFHDDMNDTGQFLGETEDGEFWFSYGDNHLFESSRYLGAGNFVRVQEDPTSLLNELGLKLSSYEGRKAKLAIARAMERVHAAPDPAMTWTAISVENSDLFGWCLLMVCRKAEVVVGGPPPGIFGSECKRSPESILITCWSSVSRVTRAAAVEQKRFLETQIPLRRRAEEWARLPEWVRSIAEEGFDTDIVHNNGDTLHVKYEERASSVAPEKLNRGRFEAWGPRFGVRAGAAGDGSELFGDWSLLRNSRSTTRNDVSVGFRFLEVNGSHYSFLDGINGTTSWPLGRQRIGELLNFAVRAEGGLDRIWDGSHHRQGYLGAGMEVQFEFGRYLVTVQPQVEYTLVFNHGWSRGFSISVNFRVAGLVLSGAPE